MPAHQHVYEQLREMILFGDLAPGQAVTIQGLTDRLDARHDTGTRGPAPPDLPKGR